MNTDKKTAAKRIHTKKFPEETHSSKYSFLYPSGVIRPRNQLNWRAWNFQSGGKKCGMRAYGLHFWYKFFLGKLLLPMERASKMGDWWSWSRFPRVNFEIFNNLFFFEGFFQSVSRVFPKRSPHFPKVVPTFSPNSHQNIIFPTKSNFYNFFLKKSLFLQRNYNFSIKNWILHFFPQNWQISTKFKV